MQQEGDPLGLLEGALVSLERACDAMQGATDVDATLRRRYGNYSRLIGSLKNKAGVILAHEIEGELIQLTGLFSRVVGLKADNVMANVVSKTKRGGALERVEQLHEVDREVMRQFAVLVLKGAFTSSRMDDLQVVDMELCCQRSSGGMIPSRVLEMAAVPAQAPSTLFTQEKKEHSQVQIELFCVVSLIAFSWQFVGALFRFRGTSLVLLRTSVSDRKQCWIVYRVPSIGT